MKLVDRVKNILLQPKAEWEVIKNETHSVKELYLNYAVLLAAIPAVASFLGFVTIGISTGFGNFTLPFGTSFKYAVLTYIFSLASAYLVAFIVDILAPNFGSEKNMEDSLKVVIFSYTASWVGGIFLLIPSLSFLSSLAGIYSLVLLYIGMQKIKNVPQDKIAAYFVITLIAAIIITVVISTVISATVFDFSAEFGMNF